MSTTTTPIDTTIPCTAGIRVDESGNRTIWIRLPRTGFTITISGGFTQELPPRLFARVAKARSEGRSVAEFTRDELLAVKALAEKIANRPRYRGGPSTWSRLGRKHR